MVNVTLKITSVIFTPHLSNIHMRPSATDVVGWSVCLSVWLSVVHYREPCKEGWTDEDAKWWVQGTMY